MISLSLSSTPRKSLFQKVSSLFGDKQTITLPDGRRADRAALRAFEQLSPHLLRDIGLTDY